MKRLPLRNRIGQVVAEALVDDADFEWLNQRRWCLGTKGYVIRRASPNEPGTTLRMSRLILGLETGDRRQADHINRDKLDNRRCNLRIVANHQNERNEPAYRDSTSSYRGVALMKNGRWRANVRANGVLHYLGEYENEREAAYVALAARERLLPFAERGQLS